MSAATTRDYCPICSAEVDRPVDTIGSMAAAPRQIAEAVRASASSRGPGWSPAEVAAHMADTEVVSGWRLRQILAENEPTIQPYDQDKWATSLHYGERDTDLALEAFDSARQANLELLRLLSDEDWERAYSHSEYGRLTLRILVQHLSEHDLTHMGQIRGG
jgi:DinB superfamily